LLKKKENKVEKGKKELKTKTWSDMECEGSDEEYANICLMANSNSKEESR